MSAGGILLLGLVSKLVIYVSLAMLAGGVLMIVLTRKQPGFSVLYGRYIWVGLVIASLALVVNFLAQVGSFAEEGWMGMFDPAFVAMLWDTEVGSVTLVRGLALGGMCILMLTRSVLAFPLWSVLAFINLLVLMASFTLAGHTTEISMPVRFLLGIHVFTALLWLGALLPLWQACQLSDRQALQQLMHQFGQMAVWMVGVLLFCGVTIAWYLVGNLTGLFSTSYGLMLLSKVMLVIVMLGLAARHKLNLVPQLNDPVKVVRLRRSIVIEMIFGLGVLVITVVLTTVTGPESVH